MPIVSLPALAASVTAVALAVAAAGPASAAPLLEVLRADGASEDFDRTRLEDLPSVEFTTSSLWTDGPVTFSGPPLSAVLGAAGIAEGTVELVAENAYSVDLDLGAEVVTETYPIIATRRDGEPFAIRDNGPLWVMFPFDDTPELRAGNVYDLSIWQLVEIRQIEP